MIDIEYSDDDVMVTIRCITYNHEPYIRQCLEGFVMQKTSFRFEAIVHDDASTDGTAVIIKEYAEKYPDIIKPIFETENQYSKHDGSIRRIMNEHTHGKYVAMCEGDDYWIDPYKLQKQVDFLNNNPDYILVYTDVEKVNQNSERVLRNSLRGASGDLSEYFFKKGNPIVTATVCLHSKYIIDYENYFHKTPFKMQMGDLPLWLYVSKLGKFKYFEEKTTAYRILKESASHSNSKDKMVSFVTNARDILLHFNEYYNIGISEDVIYKNYYKSLIRNMATFQKKDFVDSLMEGIKKYPTLLFNLKLWILFFVKVIFGKKC